MRIAFFSTKPYDQRSFEAVNEEFGHDLTFFEAKINPKTAGLAQGCECVCTFVNDPVDAETLQVLAQQGCKLLALRCAGFNQVDIAAATQLGILVVRVPAYSPAAVAEHTFGLILTLNRRIHRAYNRVREGNFALEGLLGSDLRGKTLGVVGTGRIGQLVVEIARGFGMNVLAYDVFQNPACIAAGASYEPLPVLLRRSHIVSLHCPLMPETKHLINASTISQMRPGVMLVNTSRGALIDTQVVVQGLKSGKIGALALDVYEQESELFFEDLSDQIIQDDVFERLMTFPNVLVTAHQAFFTQEALQNIAETTLMNVQTIQQGQPCPNQVLAP
jgi:D-lactate dehydrogenase